jgi:hypothetical protein
MYWSCTLVLVRHYFLVPQSQLPLTTRSFVASICNQISTSYLAKSSWHQLSC